MPQQLFGDMEAGERIVICDMEAGVGSIVRQGKGDLVIAVAEPSVKSIDVARRAAGAAEDKGAKVIVVANRVRGDEDAEAVRAHFRGHEVVVVPEDPAIAAADEDGRAPIDVAPDAPGVLALLRLADRLCSRPAAP